MLALVDHGDGLWKIVRRERVIVQASMKGRSASASGWSETGGISTSRSEAATSSHGIGVNVGNRQVAMRHNGSHELVKLAGARLQHG